MPLVSVVDPWGQQRYLPFLSTQIPVPSDFTASTEQHSLVPLLLFPYGIKLVVGQHWLVFLSGQEAVVPPMHEHVLFLLQQVTKLSEFTHSVKSVELQ